MKALALFLGFIAGIVLLSFSSPSLFFLGALFFLCILLYVVFCIRKSSAYILSSLFLLAMILGGVRTSLAQGSLPEPLISQLDTTVTLSGKIIDDPDIRETTARVTLLVYEGGAKTKVLAVVPLFPEIKYGETVVVEGTLTRPEKFETDTGRIFRYDSFLAKDGIYALVERASILEVFPRENIFDEVRGSFSDIKRAGIHALSTALPEPQAGLAGGLILGGKQGLGSELLNDFILAGLVHVVVLSGYNVMIVAEAVLRLFSLFAKRFAVIAAGIVIGGFVLVAGAGAASVRAGIMASIALFGRSTGRTYDAFRALMAAGVLMLLINPLLLIYDPGFQLSFIATLGLMFGTPITTKWASFVRPVFLREITASTISAQIAVLPLLLYQNGLFSLVALPANVLILPLVPLAMALSAVAGFAGFLTPALAPFLGLPAHFVLSLIIGATEFFAQLPFAGIAIPAFPFFFVVTSYLALSFFVPKKRKTT